MEYEKPLLYEDALKYTYIHTDPVILSRQLNKSNVWPTGKMGPSDAGVESQ